MEETRPIGLWYRTCQECGHYQTCKEPVLVKGELSEAYRNSKCKKCRSDALDYGTMDGTMEDWQD